MEVGDERKLDCERVSPNLQLQMQGLKIQQNLYNIDLGGVNVILGIAWLAGLGDIRANFRELTLRILVIEGYHTLKGDSVLTKVVALSIPS